MAQQQHVGRILELDGFRAIAVSMVMLEHMVDGWPLPEGATAWMPGILRGVISHGWLGVDLFFILSGFLITGILLDEREHANYFRNFYGRRALRILPLAIVCIAIWWLTYGHPYGRYFLLALIFCANLDVLFGVPTPHGPGVLWSLAVEEHFYLVWPIAVRVFSRYGLLIAALAVVILSPLARAWAFAKGMRADDVYQLSWFRFDGLALGAILAIWIRTPSFTPRTVSAVVVLWLAVIALLTVATIPYGVLQPRSLTSVALRYPQAQGIFAGAMALALAYQGVPLLAPLRSGVAQFIAKLSYCLYLVHRPLGDLYYWTLGRMGIEGGSLALRSMVIIAASFGVAILSQKYLEAPFMRLRGRFR
jgi:peptidoglycan/LPS O-acetylase OafA/YrhL